MTSVRPEPDPAGADLILDFGALASAPLATAGGKALNLGKLATAGLPVPPGFCVTTAAYRLAAPQELAEIAARLDGINGFDQEEQHDDGSGLPEEERNQLARSARETMRAAPVPPAVDTAVRDAYAAMGGGPVAVRSSATSEDLPFASFAGQQDSFMDVTGAGAVVQAVRNCWASLWTDRAVAYRAANRISQREVSLAVVIQRMVPAATAGVLFTANPVTGTRTRTVIDATSGPGQAVVSGAVNPDHFVLDTASGRVLQRPQDGAPTLTDVQLRELASLGSAAQKLLAAPQDVEWVIDGGGKAWLTQSRPITTLYPLPEEATPARAADGQTRAYLCATLLQGLTRPITPMGLSVLGIMRNTKGPWKYACPGLRLYVDLTPVMRNKYGRRWLLRMLPLADGRSAAVFPALLEDPRFSVVRSTPGRRGRTRRGGTPAAAGQAKAVAGISSLWTIVALFPAMARAVLRPEAVLRRARRYQEQLETLLKLAEPATPEQRLQHAEGVLGSTVDGIIESSLPGPSAGYVMLAAARRLLRGIAKPRELEAVLRGLPHNVTTEMDLELWRLAVAVSEDADARHVFTELRPHELAARYRAGTLPRVAQESLHGFLGRYGHRAVAEIDLGMPRWAEEPDHLLGMVSNYLRVQDPEQAPDRQFARAAAHADERVRELVGKATARSRLRGQLLALSLRRVRQLSGLRELPKFYIVLVMAEMHRQLDAIGAELAKAGSIAAAGDVFFLDFDELRVALRGADLRKLVAERRRMYGVELRRRHVPRLLLSDGTDVEAAAAARTAALSQAAAVDRLTGTPASAGTATGKARVILDPVGAHVEPGEILVAPSTDPGWTPLFMTAGALVMEMGGVISHGAVVAREYGIPAVVGVADATTQLRDGQVVTVDGATGTVTW
ncbi:PEP/pyruvate-binding domain-containing protein [Pseudarthrobacter defluvii]|uniref:PEP/pyruvate-binding domain-containing protein n=1 Tax=Pseudarthrobacter defluvii TaxID=410837 RepID=UPI002577BCFA|nr:PEP/pyruvate-binding domain-containing protein [Pseudarthrobacter defluvii]WJH25412.1 pyruvate kinase [Pseudarthrobacter defluvii]